MSVYIFLLILIAFISVYIGSDKNNPKKRKYSTVVFFSMLFLIFSLRDYSVGRDLQGYSDVYEMTAGNKWFDASWVWMEPGYVFLMKLGNELGMTFRQLLFFCNFIILFPLAQYIYKYFKDVALSLVIYVCFQFFVFHMSGLRQSMAMSLCLSAFLTAQKNGIKPFLEFLMLVAVASLIHRSAMVFFAAYLIMRIPINLWWGFLYTIIGIGAFMQSGSILRNLQNNEITNYEFNSSLTIGSSFVMLLVFLVISIVVSKNDRNGYTGIRNTFKAKDEFITLSIKNYANILAISILFLVAFSGSILMRAATYYELVFLILIPELFSRLSTDNRKIIKVVFIALMIAIFYFTVLLPSQFDIVPYKLGSDL